MRLRVESGRGSRWVVLEAGGARTLTALGLRFVAVSIPAKIARVVPGGPASIAGLEAGDRIVSIDGLAVRDWPALVARIRSSPGKLVRLGVRRGGRLLTLPVRIGREALAGRMVGALWVRADVPVVPKGWTVRLRYGPLPALEDGAQMAWRLSVLELKAVWHLITLRSSLQDFADSRWIAALAGGGSTGSVLAFLAEASITCLLHTSLGDVSRHT